MLSINNNPRCNKCKKSCKQFEQAEILYCSNPPPIKAVADFQAPYIPLSPNIKKKIKELVKKNCANYDREYNLCLLMDAPCYMMSKQYNDKKNCLYFQNVVSAYDSELQAVLTDISLDMSSCKVCGKKFPKSKNKKYCSEICFVVNRKARDKALKQNAVKKQG